MKRNFRKALALLLLLMMFLSIAPVNVFAEVTEPCMHLRYITVNAVDPTCADPGRIKYKKCAYGCDYYLDMKGNVITKEDTIIPATGAHTYDESGTCTFCGMAKVHTHDGGAATCLSLAVCTECGESYGELNPGNHESDETYVLNSVEASCKSQGYTGDTYYKCCDTLKEKGTTVSASAHTEITKTENEVAPTCSSEGSYDVVTFCTVCSAEINRETFTVPATGEHSYIIKVEGTETKATCTSEGRVTMRCLCSAETVVKFDIDPANHSWGEWFTVTEASCTEKGLLKRVCKYNPSHYETKETASLGHDLIKIEANEATCTIDGNIEYYLCKTCNKKYLDSTGNTEVFDVTTDKLEHSFTEYVSDNNATCTEDGTETALCSRCKSVRDTREKANSALGHSFTRYISDNNATCISDGTTTAICDICKIAKDTKTDVGSKDFAQHSPDEKGSKCLLCNKQLSSEHTWSTEEVVLKEATCTEDGIKAIVCLECGEIKADSKKVIVSTGHSYIDEWDEVLIPGCAQVGVKIKVCKNCYEVLSEVIPAIGHKDDNSDGICDTCDFVLVKPEEPKPENPDEPSTTETPEAPADPTINCDCACHSTGFSKFMFNILNFFYKIFGINRVCKCGASH